MNRAVLINELIKANNYSSYLEIGVHNGSNLNNVECVYKRGVDPNLITGYYSSLNHRMFQGTSNDFFAQTKETFDIVFIDGHHGQDQFILDIDNSLEILNPGGTIVCHDLLPTQELHQVYPQTNDKTLPWTGDVWKGWVKLRRERMALKMVVIDTDWGCGLIQRGSQKTINVKDEELTWSNFRVRKKKWLNIVKSIPDDYKN